MEQKKLPEANLEKKRLIFFQIGFIIALLIILMAFEWTTYGVSENSINKGVLVSIEMEFDVVPEIQKETPKPPKPAPQLPDYIPMVDNNSPLTEEMEYPDAERVELITYLNTVDFEQETVEELILLPIEQQAMFPGGEKALKKFIADNIEYPQQAIEKDIKGRVYVHFAIDSNGKVKDVKVIKKVHPLLDKEALRIVNMLPNWKPATQNGRKVSMGYTIPVTFWFE